MKLQTITCSNSLVLNGRLPFWKDSSRPPVSSWNPPFWDYPGLNVRSLWIFQVNHNSCKFDVRILTAFDKIRCVVAIGYHLTISSRSVSTKSTFTWETKWTQTGMRFHFGWKSHFGVQSAPYLCSHELRQNEIQNGMDFISVILNKVKFRTGMRFSCEQNLP